MKKILIASVIATAFASAHAQSNVTLYGKIDLWMGTTKQVGSQMGSGGLAGSRWGLKGSEDLGGGLNAIFLLESGFSADIGAGGGGFGRQSYVGLSGGWGELKLGNVFTPLDDINGAANSGFDSALSATSNVWLGYNSNPGAQVYYASPDIGGFSGAVSTSLTRQKADTVTSLHLKYSSGPVFAGFSYQTDKQTVSGANVKHTLLNGSYDFGPAKLLASYRNIKAADNGTGKANEFQLGVDVPVSERVTVSAGFASSKTKTPAGAVARDADGYGLAASYTLSARTVVYGGYQRSDVKAPGATTVKDHLVAVGINHSF